MKEKDKSVVFPAKLFILQHNTHNPVTHTFSHEHIRPFVAPSLRVPNGGTYRPWPCLTILNFLFTPYSNL